MIKKMWNETTTDWVSKLVNFYKDKQELINTPNPDLNEQKRGSKTLIYKRF